MEKRSIGAFIATLRKATGLTQKQLAEKLNVSDKAISRWERDECAPDLSLIPVIAEIFGVTADELLRGQRNNPENSTPETAEKHSEKQLKYLLKDIRTKYKIRSTITVGIGITGLLAAMICNFGFNRAYIGFGVSMVFFLVSAVCQTIFTILAFSSVDEDNFSSTSLTELKKNLAGSAFSFFSCLVVQAASVLPLIIFPQDTYQSLRAGSWLLSGLGYAGLTTALLIFLRWLALPLLAKHGYLVSRQELTINRLKMRWSAICAALLILTVFGWLLTFEIPSSLFVKGTTFDNWDDFKVYMETPVDYDFGNPLMSAVNPDEDFAYMETIYASDGATLLCSYHRRNNNIGQIHFGEDNMLPVTVYTYADLRSGSAIRNALSAVFLIPAGLEIALCLRQYRKRKAIMTETSGLD